MPTATQEIIIDAWTYYTLTATIALTGAASLWGWLVNGRLRRQLEISEIALEHLGKQLVDASLDMVDLDRRRITAESLAREYRLRLAVEAQRIDRIIDATFTPPRPIELEPYPTRARAAARSAQPMPIHPDDTFARIATANADLDIMIDAHRDGHRPGRAL